MASAPEASRRSSASDRSQESEGGRAPRACADAYCITGDLTPREALRMAAELLGGRDQLTEALGVNATSLDTWLSGQSEPRAAVVFAALGLAQTRRS